MKRMAFWLLGGLASYGLAALLENYFQLGILGGVLAEEGEKLALLALGLFAARGEGRGRGLLLGLGAIVVFGAAENLGYYLAFPGRDLLLRLFLSEPVHLVSGLSWALALAGLGGAGKPGGRDLARALALGALALAWHGGFNLLASAPGLGRHGWFLGLGALSNAIALIVLIRCFAQRILIGGFLYGRD